MEDLYKGSVYQKIREYGIMPLVTLDNANDALLLGRALVECNLPVVEITFRTEAAADAIRLLKEKYPELLIGAGTVLTPEMAETAIDAGATFVLAPGINPEVVQYCQERGILPFPGCMTPSDLELAGRLGLKCVKIFPFIPMGGVSMLKAISAPFPTMEYLATGGVNSSNLAECLQFPKVIACGGSWLIDKTFLQSGSLEKLKKDIHQAIVNMLGLCTSWTPEKMFGGKEEGLLQIMTIDFDRAISYFKRIGYQEDTKMLQMEGDVSVNRKVVLKDGFSEKVFCLAEQK